MSEKTDFRFVILFLCAKPPVVFSCVHCRYPQPPLQDKVSREGRPLDPFLNAEFKDVVDGSASLESLNNMDVGAAHRRVHCFSNPCTFKINETVFGVTSTDVMFHLNSESINSDLQPGSRFGRIAQHIHQQRSFYPLFPAPASYPTNLDLTMIKNWEVPCRPDVLILPSKLIPFAKSLPEDAIVVNPGLLTKGNTGGTYAMLEVEPIERATLDNSDGKVEMEHKICSRIQVEVKRI